MVMLTESVKLGYVVAVSGSKVTGILDNIRPGDLGIDGETPFNEVPIGSLVKVDTGRSVAVGVVNGLHIRDPQSSPGDTDVRVMDIDLLGEAIGSAATDNFLRFERGVSIYPGLGQAIWSTTSDDLAQVYSRPNASNVRIGSIHQASELPAFVLTDELLGKHFGILGTTGSGKSCSVALILREILTAHPNGHVVLLDPHAEYARSFGDMAEVITTETLKMPYWLLNSEEMVEVLCSKDTNYRGAESAILKESVLAAKKNFLGDGKSDSKDVGWLTVDTPVPYPLRTLMQIIDDGMGKLDKPENSIPYLRLKTRIETMKTDKRFGFMFGGFTVRDTMHDIMSQLLRIPVAGKPVTVLDLSGVPTEVVDVVVSVMCRLIFDFSLWTDREESVPVLLVCEEAHQYMPRDEKMGFAPTRRAISRIAREGRKYGVSLALVTQRPSEISEAILSQCNTLFALRMSNEQDQEFVRCALPDSAAGLLGALPALRTQEAIVVGEGVRLPMRIKFDDLPEDLQPRSTTAPYSSAWQKDVPSTDLIGRTLERWRHQLK